SFTAVASLVSFVSFVSFTAVASLIALVPFVSLLSLVASISSVALIPLVPFVALGALPTVTVPGPRRGQQEASYAGPDRSGGVRATPEQYQSRDHSRTGFPQSDLLWSVGGRSTSLHPDQCPSTEK